MKLKIGMKVRVKPIEEAKKIYPDLYGIGEWSYSGKLEGREFLIDESNFSSEDSIFVNSYFVKEGMLEEVPVTNRDVLRNMTNEELAYFLCGMTYCQECPHSELCCHANSSAEKNGFLTWLEQEANNDEV